VESDGLFIEVQDGKLRLFSSNVIYARRIRKETGWLSLQKMRVFQN